MTRSRLNTSTDCAISNVVRRLLLTCAGAAALAGCTRLGPSPQLPPPVGPLMYWYVHESSEEEGKITFRCDETVSPNCADQTELWNVQLHAEKRCRDWGYDGLGKSGLNFGWSLPNREGVRVRNQTSYRCRKPKRKQI